MSYSLSGSGSAEEIVTKLEEAFANNYPEPALGVEEQIESSIAFVNSVVDGQEGNFSASLSGHVNQGEDDPSRSSASVSVSPTS